MTDPYPIFHQNVDKKIVEIIKKLDSKEKAKLIAINYYVEQKKALDKKLEKEINILIKKKEEKFQKYIKEEKKIISGDIDDIPEGAQKWLNEYEMKKEYFNQDDPKLREPIIYNNQESKPVDNYWFHVLTGNPSIKSLIKEGDNKLAEAITNIEYTRDNTEDKDSHNFTISFYFDMSAQISKEYLKGNGIIRKSFKMYNSVMPLSSEVQLDTRKGFGKDSFFKFFEPRNLQDALDKDEDERKNIENKMGKDFEIAQLLIQEIIPYSLEYYLQLRQEENLDKDDQMDGEQAIEHIESQDTKKKKVLKKNENLRGLECKTF